MEVANGLEGSESVVDAVMPTDHTLVTAQIL